MRILGVDTATSTASVALIEDGKLAAEESYPAGSETLDSTQGKRANHAEIILPLIDAVLSRRGLTVSELSGLAVSIGPGSFTGLRIGLSTVKGLAYASATPVVGIPTLLAHAARATRWRGLICAFLDARKSEVYAGLFRNEEGNLSRLAEDFVAPAQVMISKVQSRAGQDPCLFVGDGVESHKKLLAETLGMQAHVIGADRLSSVAAAVARLSEERFRRADVDSPESLRPLYLRLPEAELKLRDMS
jgi:tRNA threonylcarbamoyladenosine biosynthesis protein TsaB